METGLFVESNFKDNDLISNTKKKSFNSNMTEVVKIFLFSLPYTEKFLFEVTYNLGYTLSTKNAIEDISAVLNVF
jgi:hypothetical protein